MKKTVFLNGRFQQLDPISPLKEAAISGYGVFETMRSYNGHIIGLSEHLSRIKSSSSFLKMDSPYGQSKLKQIIRKVVRINGCSDAVVRLVISIDGAGCTSVLVEVTRHKPLKPDRYKSGFRVEVSRFRQNQSSPLARIKSTNRILYQLSLEEARRCGYDEAIILNSRGYITECTRSNIFFVRGKSIYTPSTACGCLKGVTRDKVRELAGKVGYKVYEGSFVVGDLIESDEAFLTGSLIGVMPLVSVGRRVIGRRRCGATTTKLIRRYNSLFLKR